MRFSTHDPSSLAKKFVDESELWKQTEDMVRKVLVDTASTSSKCKRSRILRAQN